MNPDPFPVTVRFHSYFRDLAGCDSTVETVSPGTTLGALQDRLLERFPRLKGLQRSTLAAVGVDYQDRSYLLQPNDEVSFFPPVQGG